MKSTRHRLLDAVVTLLAREGMQAVSHRAVEQEAAATHGSTSYYFKTRDALLEEVIRHLADRDEAVVLALLDDERLRSPEHPQAAAEALATAVARFLDDARDETLARFELFLYAARRPELRAELSRWSGYFAKILVDALTRLGAAEPEESARLFAAALDGLLLTGICLPDRMPRELLQHHVRALLAACLAGPDGAPSPDGVAGPDAQAGPDGAPGAGGLAVE